MHAAIPKLRKDIEVHFRSNNTVDVRDPHLLQIYTLDADDFRLAKTFDGSDAKELAKKLRAVGAPHTAAEIRQVAKEFDELMLLDRPAVWKAEPTVENVAPFSQIDTKRGLKVLPVADENARWTCHGCGDCCHGLAVEITKEEEGRIDASLYRDILGDEDFAENSFLNPDEPAKRTLRQREDDNYACIFLAKDGLCNVHARQGMAAKPDACQIFPAMVLMMPDGSPPRVGLRTNCSSMYKSFESGPLVSEMIPHVLRIVKDKGEVHKAPKKVRMFKKDVPFAKLDEICRHMAHLFAEAGINAETILQIDRKFLGGRVKKSMKAYGKEMLAYMKEKTGPAPVEEGAYHQQISRVAKGLEAIQAMKAGRLPSPPSKKIDAFLRAQMAHVLYMSGPLNLPDAGFALVGEMLSMLAMLHAIGRSTSLKNANTAFEVFMQPLLETMEHAWPILDAIDKRYATALREEVQ